MVVSTQPPERGERVVVISPHLDDGVLSLGAAMSSWARLGARIELLTVLGCDPGSDAPAGGWDRRGGFATEGGSARARRDEDARACEILGASPTWLPFGSIDYERHGDEDSIIEAVTISIVDADLVLLPGYPLSHPDHEWLVRTILDRKIVRPRCGFYAEQPYAARATRAPVIPAWLSELIGFAPEFTARAQSPRSALAKWRAIRCYRSQLPLLAMTGVRRGPHVAAWRRELVTESVLE